MSTLDEIRHLAAANCGLAEYPAAAVRAAEHPAEFMGEWIRDVPASCACSWMWSAEGRRFVRTKIRRGCHWHG